MCGGRHTVTLATGGFDDHGNPKPNVARWLEELRLSGVDWSRTGSLTTGASGVQQIAVDAFGTVFSRDGGGRVRRNTRGGVDGAWDDLGLVTPSDVASFSASTAGLLYQRADRSLWSVAPPSAATRVGRPSGAVEVADTEDATLDFRQPWARNGDGSLWFNGVGGLDGGWVRRGSVANVVQFSVARTRLFAVFTDGSLRTATTDDLTSWTRVGSIPGTVDIAAAAFGQADDIFGQVHLYRLDSAGALYRGTLRRGD